KPVARGVAASRKRRLRARPGRAVAARAQRHRTRAGRARAVQRPSRNAVQAVELRKIPALAGDSTAAEPRPRTRIGRAGPEPRPRVGDRIAVDKNNRSARTSGAGAARPEGLRTETRRARHENAP